MVGHGSYTQWVRSIISLGNVGFYGGIDPTATGSVGVFVYILLTRERERERERERGLTGLGL